jgi:single-strand DNA-binding protein
MSYEAIGKLIVKGETENKTATFQAREFVIEMAGQYPQMVKFQLTQDRCDALDNFNEGDSIKVKFDLRGREYNGKYFTNLNAWRLEKGGAIQSAQPQQQAQPSAQPSPVNTPTPEPVAGQGDDLPF